RAMDMMLTGRAVTGEEAFAFGLANRVTPPGGAFDEALRVARLIASFPQRAMRGDRRSLLEQWDLTEDEAMRNELRLGFDTITSGETVAGATRFARGDGRHGAGVSDPA